MKKLYSLALRLVMLLVATQVFAATSVSRHGITWTWVEDLTVGTYANGDPYVVAPSGLTMTSISPLSVVDTGRTINGTMINPTAGASVEQGFDSGILGFNAAKNDGRPNGNDLSVGNPLSVPAGSSVVSTESRPTYATNETRLLNAAVLTVVATEPAAGSFRPPYCGTDKTPHWNVSDLDYSVLQSVAPVAATPSLATIEAYNERVWIEIRTSWVGRQMHPENNQPDYGEDICKQTGDQLLSTHLNYTNEQKETMVIRLVQYGLDIYGAAVTGGTWNADGGHNQGRKGVLMFAGYLLGDTNILAYGDADLHYIFQEDQQSFTVDASQMSVTPASTESRPLAPYGGGGSAPYISPYTSTVTISNATPAVIGWTGHGLMEQLPIYFTTTGELPAPLEPATIYWISATGLATDSFQIAAYGKFRGSAQPASINTTSAGSGTHTAHYAMLGVADWGIRHSSAPTSDGANWDSVYRSTNTNVWRAHCLAMRMLDGGAAITTWNWAPYFDYNDRAFESAPPNTSSFSYNMWAVYRNPSAGPTVASATVNAAGTSLTIEFTASCTNGAGGAGGMVLYVNGTPVSTTYSSGSGSTTYVYTVPVVGVGATLSLSYTQPGNGIESTVGGVDVDSFSGLGVANNSTQQQPAVMSNGSRQRLFPGGGGF